MAVSAFTLFGEIKADTSDFKKGLTEADASLKKFASRMDETESLVSARLRSIGDGMASVGRAMTATITAPLAALGAISAKSAMDFDVLRTGLLAATGDTGAAAAKFKELNKLAMDNVGVMTSGAAATYGFLKPLGFMDDTITETIKAFGKLKAANPDIDLSRMGMNLSQLFDQGFEAQDIKELLGAFPRAGEILQKAFGLSGSDRKTIAEEMKGLVGKGLTREDFFKAFAAGVNNDATLSKLVDPMTVKFQKSMEQIKLALEPLGLIIVDALARATPYVVSFVQTLSAAFQQLSPTIQTAIVAFDAIVAALGPVLIGVGQFASWIASLGVSLPSLGSIAIAIAAIGAALAPVIVTAAFFSKEWLANWELVKQIFQAGYDAVSGVMASLMTTLQGYWAEHGASVMAYLSAWWTTLIEAVSAWFGIIGNVLNVALQVIQGNWQGAWEAVLKLTENAWALITQLITNALSTNWKLIQAAAPIIADVFVQLSTKLLQIVGKAIAYIVYFVATLPQQLVALVPKLLSAGMQIGSAIWQGIQKGFMSGGGGSGAIDNPAGPMEMFGGLIEQFKNAFGGGPQLAMAGGTVFTPTVNALDTVKTKLDDVGKAASKAAAPVRSVLKAGAAGPAKAAAKAASAAAGGAINATIKGLSNGKGGTYDLKIQSFDTKLASRDQATKAAMKQAYLEAIEEVNKRGGSRDEVFIRIQNEATDSARVTRGPRPSDTNRRYGS